jgi:hypothetical protein
MQFIVNVFLLAGCLRYCLIYVLGYTASVNNARSGVVHRCPSFCATYEQACIDQHSSTIERCLVAEHLLREWKRIPEV